MITASRFIRPVRLIAIKLLVFLSPGIAPILHAQQDTVLLKNNDRVIGEIKSMNQGILQIETDYSDDDFTITWVEIVQINSTRNYLITLTDGRRLNGSLKNSNTREHVVLETESGKFEIPIRDVVYIKPVESNILSRFDASLSLGLNFAKSNNLKQFTVRSTLGYTSNFWRVRGNYNSVRSGQDDTEEIKRWDGAINFRYFLKNDYFTMFTSDFLSNTEQLLNIRMNNKLGFGKYFVHNNKLYLGGGAGLGWNYEVFDEDQLEVRNSLEAFAALEANLFDIKDFSLISTLTVYPSITERNRFRTDFNLDLKYDLPLDFFIKVGLTYNFDNQPVEGAARDDYVIQTTFGWEL